MAGFFAKYSGVGGGGSGGGGASGITNPSPGRIDVTPDDSGESTIVLGSTNGEGFIFGASGVPGDSGVSLTIAAGDSADSNGGAVTISTGTNQDTGQRNDIYMAANRTLMQCVLNLNPINNTLRDALSPQPGDVIFNSEVGALQFYNNGVWNTISYT